MFFWPFFRRLFGSDFLGFFILWIFSLRSHFSGKFDIKKNYINSVFTFLLKLSMLRHDCAISQKTDLQKKDYLSE